MVKYERTDLLETLKQVKREFWEGAWKEGRRIGLTQDGIYDRRDDLDLICMYCSIEAGMEEKPWNAR